MPIATVRAQEGDWRKHGRVSRTGEGEWCCCQGGGLIGGVRAGVGQTVSAFIKETAVCKSKNRIERKKVREGKVGKCCCNVSVSCFGKNFNVQRSQLGDDLRIQESILN